jgi:hypothetical protein
MLRITLAALAAAVLCALTCPRVADAASNAKPARLAVTMTERACKVARSIRPGQAVFRISNRGRRPRTFSIAGRRSAYVMPQRTAMLRVRLVGGRTYRYACTARGMPRSVKRGAIRVSGTVGSPRRAPPPPSARALFVGDFETGNLSQWDNSFQQVPGRFSVVAADGAVSSRQGSRMARVEIRQGDDPIDTGGNICMVYRYDNVSGHYDVYGTDRYAGFSVYIPAGFPYVPSQLWNYVFEWHGDNNSQAPFKIGINSIISAANPTVGFAAELNYGRISGPSQTRWRLGNLATGRWVDFVARVKWSLTDGIVEVWMNGVKKVSATGIKTWYTSGQSSVKPQLGYYRSAYSRTAVLYLDAFKIGNSYESVRPES